MGELGQNKQPTAHREKYRNTRNKQNTEIKILNIEEGDT